MADCHRLAISAGDAHGLPQAAADGLLRPVIVQKNIPFQIGVAAGTGDSARIYPGDGDLPLGQALRDLETIGYQGALSLELFNEKLWKQPVEQVCMDGLHKMRENILAAAV